MVGSASSALDIEGRGKRRSLAFGLALANLEDVCRQLTDLEDLYDAKKKALLEERNEMIRDAVRSRVAVRQLQIVTGLSRNRLYQLRSGGRDD